MRAVDSRATALTVSQRYFLLRVALNQLCGDRYQIAKQASCALVGASRKVKLRSRRFIWVVAIRSRSVREAHAPDSLNGKRFSSRILNQAFELARVQVVGRDESRRLR